MQTETSFNAQELDKFQVRGEPSVTFSIRELKVSVLVRSGVLLLAHMR